MTTPSSASGFLLALLLFLANGVQAQSVDVSFETVKVADGVYAFIPPTGGSFVNGNSVVIIGRDAAMVVDSAHFPSMTRAMIAAIRKLSDKPVRFLLNTHWHADHISGNSVYRELYPEVVIISTRSTRDMEANFPERFDDVNQIKAALPSLERTAAKGVGDDGKPITQQRRKELDDLVRLCRTVLPEVESVRRVPPNLTFDKQLTIDLGGRVVEVSFQGRGNTAGDAIAYIPDVKALVTGDLVVSPIPYAFESFVSDWIDTLGNLERFNAIAIVPGHGSQQRDFNYTRTIREMLQKLRDDVKAQVAANRTNAQILSSVKLNEYAEKLAGADTRLQQEFASFFLVPATKQVIKEFRPDN